MPFRTPQEANDLTQKYQQFVKYIVPQVQFDPFFSKFDFEYDTTSKANALFSPHHSSSIVARFDSQETVYSKQFKKKVMVDFLIDYSLVSHPEWMKTQINNWMTKGQCCGYVHYFDDETCDLIKAVPLPIMPSLPQWLEAVKRYLSNDIVFGGGDEQEPQPEPQPTFPSGKSKELVNENAEMALASWVVKNCKFATS